MKKFITEKDLLDEIKKGQTEFTFSDSVSFTPAAKDIIKKLNLKINLENIKSNLDSDIVSSIAIGCDHTGYTTKLEIIKFLQSKKLKVIDVGTNSETSCDYPDYAIKVAELVSQYSVNKGIILDATGIPSAIAANKVKGIRAATLINEYSVKSCREHNNSNILVCGARIFAVDFINSAIDLWLNTKFLGERHQKRLQIILDYESTSKK